MPDEIQDPSQSAIDKLLQGVDADDQIPQQIKAKLADVVRSQNLERFSEIQTALTEWGQDDETKEHSA